MPRLAADRVEETADVQDRMGAVAADGHGVHHGRSRSDREEVHAGPRRGLHRGKGLVRLSVDVVEEAADVQDAPVGGEGVYAAVGGGGPGRIAAAAGAHVREILPRDASEAPEVAAEVPAATAVADRRVQGAGHSRQL